MRGAPLGATVTSPPPACRPAVRAAAVPRGPARRSLRRLRLVGELQLPAVAQPVDVGAVLVDGGDEERDGEEDEERVAPAEEEPLVSEHEEAGRGEHQQRGERDRKSTR